MARHGLSLIDVQKAFGDEQDCHSYLEAARWPRGVRCVKCNGDRISKIITNETTREKLNKKTGEIIEVRVPSRRLYQCNTAGCRHQFTTTAGTIFSDTHLPLSTWFKAIALLANAKKGVSAKQMERDLGVHYRTAWHLNHRIREAMQDGFDGLFQGTVEIDATYIGGEYDKRRKRAKYDKQAVGGVLQRGTEGQPSQVRVAPVQIEAKIPMWTMIRDNVQTDAQIYSDEHGAYRGLTSAGLKHAIVAHTSKEYVRGDVHVNSLEGFWSLFKRGLIGSFHQVSVKHLHRYLNEFSYRFNLRESRELFGLIVLNLVIGSQLKYRELVANPEESVSSPDASGPSSSEE
jgi:transposase-like protein